MNSEKSMSIRFVTRKWSPAVGGMETYCVRIVAALRNFADIDVIALPGRPDGAPPRLWHLLFFSLNTAIRLLFSKPATVTHVGDMALWPLAFAARLRSNATRVVISAHGTDVSLPLRDGAVARLYGLYLKIGAYLLRSVTVTANSAATAAAAKSSGFAHVVVIPLATDLPRQISAHPRHDRSTLLFAGRLAPRKGCGWFIRNVLPLLPREITLRVAGNVWDSDEQLALDNPRVKFLGPVYGDALINEYRSALCIVVPTRDFEGFGLTALESAASGGLALASNHSGLRDLVIDGVTGFLLPPNDADAWAQKILAIRDWPEDRRLAFITKASDATKQYYTWDRVARETLQVYLQPLPPSPEACSGNVTDHIAQ